MLLCMLFWTLSGAVQVGAAGLLGRGVKLGDDARVGRVERAAERELRDFPGDRLADAVAAGDLLFSYIAAIVRISIWRFRLSRLIKHTLPQCG